MTTEELIQKLRSMSDRELDELQAQLVQPAQPVTNEPERLPFNMDNRDILYFLGYPRPPYSPLKYMAIYNYYTDKYGRQKTGWDQTTLSTSNRKTRYTMPLTISDADMAAFKEECDRINAPLKTLAVVVQVGIPFGTTYPVDGTYIALMAQVFMYNPETAARDELRSVQCVFNRQLMQLYLNNPEAQNPSRLILKHLSQKMLGEDSRYDGVHLADDTNHIQTAKQQLKKEYAKRRKFEDRMNEIIQQKMRAEAECEKHGIYVNFHSNPNLDTLADAYHRAEYNFYKRLLDDAKRAQIALLTEQHLK